MGTADEESVGHERGRVLDLDKKSVSGAYSIGVTSYFKYSKCLCPALHSPCRALHTMPAIRWNWCARLAMEVGIASAFGKLNRREAKLRSAAGAVAQIVNLLARKRSRTDFWARSSSQEERFDFHYSFQCTPRRVDRSVGSTKNPFCNGRNRFGRMAWW